MRVFSNGTGGKSRRLWAGIFWIGTVQFFLGQFIVQLAATGYSVISDDISFLAVTSCEPFADPLSGQPVQVCSPLHAVMSSSLVATGLMVTVGAILSFPAWPKVPRGLLGVWLVTLAGLGTVASGVFSVDRSPGTHGAGALAYFVMVNLGTILIATATWSRARWFSAYSLATGTISAVAFLLYASQIDLGLGRGIIQRIARYPSIIWFIITGSLLIRSTRDLEH